MNKISNLVLAASTLAFVTLGVGCTGGSDKKPAAPADTSTGENKTIAPQEFPNVDNKILGQWHGAQFNMYVAQGRMTLEAVCEDGTKLSLGAPVQLTDNKITVTEARSIKHDENCSIDLTAGSAYNYAVANDNLELQGQDQNSLMFTRIR